jgi:alanine racemase
VYSILKISDVINGRFLQVQEDNIIQHLVYDSRKIQFAKNSIFFGIHTAHQNGHNYIFNAYEKGVRNFVVQENVELINFPEANIIKVTDSLIALQQLTSFHRSNFNLPVIGITGSNGKTIVKEWLYQMLHEDYNIVRSPKSYNSQIGVPVSVWQLNKHRNLAIFEAGISQTGEMQQLFNIIKPTIGILTNIGEAHDEGFASHEEKLSEKCKVFQNAEIVIAPEKLQLPIKNQIYKWGYSDDCDLQIISIDKSASSSGNYYSVITTNKGIYVIPFIDDASIENTITCCCTLFYLGYDAETIANRLLTLHTVDMRLQLKQGINNCIIINDTYSADITSLNIVLNFLQQQSQNQNHTVILSDFIESGKSDNELYSEIASALEHYGVQRLNAIGEHIYKIADHLPASIQLSYFVTTEDFIRQFRSSLFSNETILIKGARKFQFERIIPLFDERVHQTQLEINLSAIAHNLKQYRKLLLPKTKVMAMVKAFAYGSGGAEIASVLQYNSIDYLGVAYADEGVELRKASINTPVMVMNVDASAFSSITEYNLQPVIYSFEMLHKFEEYLKSLGLQTYPVHIEIETGMNRLGFPFQQITELAAHLQQNSLIKVESIFTHLASSEDPAQDEFTYKQSDIFNAAVNQISSAVPYFFLKHIANSAAIIRHTHFQMDMVRLGIGLYGIEINTDKLDLQPVATYRSTIAQIKNLKAGDTVSYNRSGVIKEDSTIATVRVGYADGFSRKFSSGIGKMWLKGKLTPVVGSVCMDMTMIDVTNIPDVNVGDEVIVFGKELPVQEIAKWINTIPYEIMTSVSQRVKRVYFQE